jgi:hypothetical protein
VRDRVKEKTEKLSSEDQSRYVRHIVTEIPIPGRGGRQVMRLFTIEGVVPVEVLGASVTG